MRITHHPSLYRITHWHCHYNASVLLALDLLYFIIIYSFFFCICRSKLQFQLSFALLQVLVECIARQDGERFHRLNVIQCKCCDDNDDDVAPLHFHSNQSQKHQHTSTQKNAWAANDAASFPTLHNFCMAWHRNTEQNRKGEKVRASKRARVRLKCIVIGSGCSFRAYDHRNEQCIFIRGKLR